MEKKLKFGIIGLSKGNGHPYSWSAIFNGMNYSFMRDCPFPVIPEYLSRQQFPRDAIIDAEVTHIWTQDYKISEHIAKASFIPNIVTNYTDMIGDVDAILLARDDSETHYEYAKPFIEAGLPIYIDKPIAVSLEETLRLYALEKYEGQIFTCSAMTYSPELYLKSDLGEIRYVEATVCKDWKKYSIHVIEPVLQIVHLSEIREVLVNRTSETQTVLLNWDNGVTTSFKALGNDVTPIKIVLYGSLSVQEIVFADTFHSFKNALLEFVKIIKKEKVNNSKERTLKVVEIIEKGM